MVDSIGSWLSKNKKFIAIVASILVIAIILILIGYQFDWTGFNVYTITVKSNATSGTTLPTNITVYLPSKTLYDWLQLLFVPVVLAIAGFWFNHRERKATELRAENDRQAAELRAKADREIEQQRAETEREIAEDNQREAALQAYINEMSELLLHENLRDSIDKDEVRSIARVRTISILFQLDARRIGYVFSFLLESGLTSNDPDKNIVSLYGADLEKINFSKVRLNFANLRGARLSKADLSEAELFSANLSNADLSNANLRRADLRRANLSGAELGDANLSEALLYNANLREAYLNGADLSRSGLSKADLSGALVGGANLRDTDLSEEQLKDVKTLDGATMPDGYIHYLTTFSTFLPGYAHCCISWLSFCAKIACLNACFLSNQAVFVPFGIKLAFT